MQGLLICHSPDEKSNNLIHGWCASHILKGIRTETQLAPGNPIVLMPLYDAMVQRPVGML
jgi:hypothetical protein